MRVELSQLLRLRLPIQVDAFEPVLTAFDDATHDVYRLYAPEGEFALKLLRDTSSPFWQGMQSLFGVNLVEQIAYSQTHYACAARHVCLPIPTFVAASRAEGDLPAYTLTQWLVGESIDPNCISSSLIESLAIADAQRHEKSRTTWGCCSAPQYSAQDWYERIQQLLPDVDSESLAQVASVKDFVPMIMDMRWDQCLQYQDRLSALVDIDALVFAPKALDFVMMEYWLTPEQLQLWCQTYQAHGGVIPELHGVRGLYRQLLWRWQLWGEYSEQAWMTKGSFFV